MCLLYFIGSQEPGISGTSRSKNATAANLVERFSLDDDSDITASVFMLDEMDDSTSQMSIMSQDNMQDSSDDDGELFWSMWEWEFT
jgi:hypothetical protein